MVPANTVWATDLINGDVTGSNTAGRNDNAIKNAYISRHYFKLLFTKPYKHTFMQDIVLIPGDGIGPEITQSVKTILSDVGAQINWIECIAGQHANEKEGTPLPEKTLETLQKYPVSLKGPLTTPVGAGIPFGKCSTAKKTAII